MPWTDRIQDAIYISPSGEIISGMFENVSVSFDKKTTAFEFADADGTFVQDLGRTGKRLPFRWIINGEDYDKEAARFDAMLGETGPGTLQHPIYGTFTVVPSGKISRRDDLKTRANQAVYDIEFYETNALLYPAASVDPAAQVLEDVEATNEANPPTFTDNISTETPVEAVGLRDRIQIVLDVVQSGLQAIADRNAQVQQAFDTVFQSIDEAVSTLIGDPLALAFQIQILAQLPARAASLIGDRLKAYGSLLRRLTTNGTVYVPGNDSQAANAFQADALFATNLFLGAVLSVVNNEFKFKKDAIDAAEAIELMCGDLIQWQDDNIRSLGIVDSGTVYQNLQAACASCTGLLVAISFTLLPERSIVLDRPRTPIDLEAELYGTVDSNLDFLITSNDLVGDEIFEIPAGRSVVYYS